MCTNQIEMKSKGPKGVGRWGTFNGTSSACMRPAIATLGLGSIGMGTLDLNNVQCPVQFQASV